MIAIRPEKSSDFMDIARLTRAAFKGNDEVILLRKIRKSEYYVPDLSLVALNKDRIVGHIMLSIITLVADDTVTNILSLAPLSVVPRMQDRGVGSKLIKKAITEARDNHSYPLIIVIGHPEYYPKFGFQQARSHGLDVAFEIPDEVFLVLELEGGFLHSASGIIEFSPPFARMFDQD